MIIPQNHPFFELSNKKKLARLLKVDNIRKLKRISENYHARTFTKITNKERTFYNASMLYKSVLRRINNYLQKIEFPHYIYSGIPNRDCLKNASVHMHNQYVCNIDISDFFPSTKESYVYGFFRNKLKMSSDIAKILTLLTTYPDKNNNRHIPQGFPTSTILSYLCYFDMFNGIYKFAISNGITFSVFVDDITFSANKKISKTFIKKITKIIDSYELKVNPNKIRFYRPIHHKKITGVIVNKNNLIKAPNKIQREMIENFEEIIDFKFDNFPDYIVFKQKVLKLRGLLNWIKRIESERNFEYINKIISDIESLFVVRSTNERMHNALMEEYKKFQQCIGERK
ncbi:reverse transcriptase family protein [Schinkia azotoformans]|uniref:reverse transcriptase family protein n=1 Tax=Schinkia azotoformans TaxID=1454 RepID=UPI002DB74A22|nr:reverse transcriptase family protein [Schinkia azotoformans]MEC1788613.1 reverse transcriptase family protein [Schinkia azotoformans]MED4419932.1 reverse transcriptase family protein [Schinkia azotoformans]